MHFSDLKLKIDALEVCVSVHKNLFAMLAGVVPEEEFVEVEDIDEFHFAQHDEIVKSYLLRCLTDLEQILPNLPPLADNQVHRTSFRCEGVECRVTIEFDGDERYFNVEFSV